MNRTLISPALDTSTLPRSDVHPHEPSAQIELVVGAGGLLALIVPVQLSAPRWSVVQYLLGHLKLDVALGKRWNVWGVFHVEDWVSPAERPANTLKLKFLE